MSKNPFVDLSCHQRKVQNRNAGPPKEKFCPRSMVRYDKTFGEYATKWVCKMCLKCLLSEAAVINHMIVCNPSSNPVPPTPPVQNEDVKYTCESCRKVFSRRVTLKKHMEEHDKSSSHVDSELSDNEPTQ